MSASQEPPEQGAAPVSTRNDAGTPASAQRTAAAPDDAGTPAPDERTTEVQGKAPGPRVAQQETPGLRVARSEVRGPRSAQQGSSGPVPVYRENLQGKDRQEKVAEPPGQSETETPARVRERIGENNSLSSSKP